MRLSLIKLFLDSRVFRENRNASEVDPDVRGTYIPT